MLSVTEADGARRGICNLISPACIYAQRAILHAVFPAQANKAVTAHSWCRDAGACGPWNGLGLDAAVKLGPTQQWYRYGFVATDNDDNARITFQVGAANAEIYISTLSLNSGGELGLGDAEDPAKGTVAVFARRAIIYTRAAAGLAEVFGGDGAEIFWWDAGLFEKGFGCASRR